MTADSGPVEAATDEISRHMNASPSPTDYKRPLSWVIPLFGLILVAVFWQSDANHWLFSVINQSADVAGTLWASLTIFGDTAVALSLMLPLCWWRPDIARAIIVAALIATFLTHGIKHLAAMPRPAAVLDSGALHVIGPVLTHGSFPSGHTTTIFTLAGVVCLSLRRTLFHIMLVAFAFAVGVSRIGVGAHWPVDVAGGMVVGWVSAVAGIHLGKHWTGGLSLTARRIYMLFFGGTAMALLVNYHTGYPQADMLQMIIAVTVLLLAVPSLRHVIKGE